MIAILNKLSYLKNKSSWRHISTQTGIPYRRLLRLKDIGTGFKADETKQIRNLYQRTTYKDLRNIGFSPKESARWSWQTPVTVTKQITLLQDKISQLAYGKTYDEFTEFEQEIGSKAFEQRYKEIYDAIQEGIKKSPESAEVIYDY